MINYLNSTPKDIITLKQIKYCNIYIYIYIYIYRERERERERERSGAILDIIALGHVSVYGNDISSTQICNFGSIYAANNKSHN
jgi:hypothetical protein